MPRPVWKLAIVALSAAVLQGCTLPAARPVVPPRDSEISAPPAVPPSGVSSAVDARSADQVPAPPAPSPVSTMPPETPTAASRLETVEIAAVPVAAAPPMPSRVAPTAPGLTMPASPVDPMPAQTPAAAPSVAAAPRPSPAATPATPPAPVVAAPTPTPVEINETPTSFDVRGTIELEAGSGATVEAAEVADVLLYFVPDGGAPKPTPTKSQVATRNKRFEPATLIG